MMGKGGPEGVKFQTGGDGDLQLIGKARASINERTLSPLLPLAFIQFRGRAGN